MLTKEAKRTLVVALIMCLVCSVLVAGVAVGLKSQQLANKTLDRNKNILRVAGLYSGSDKAEVQRVFSQFTVKLVDLRSGKYATEAELAAAGIKVDTYDQQQAAKNPQLSESLAGNDPAGILRLPHYAKVYLLEKAGTVELMVLPISGYGLWGTLYGFIALQGDANTIAGFGFYQHQETPGLGAEVDNPKWKALWPGKQAYAADGSVGVQVVKGPAQHPQEIDGLSGATLTTRGVDHLVQFWLGERGFARFLANIKKGEA